MTELTLASRGSRRTSLAAWGKAVGHKSTPSIIRPSTTKRMYFLKVFHQRISS